MPDSFRIAVLISGGGTTLKNLIEVAGNGGLAAEFALVLASREDAGGLQFAREADIPEAVVSHRDHADVDSFSQAVWQQLNSASPDLVVMGGFLRRLLIPPEWTHRVINIHPSLIPAFCGAGFYGRKVHQGVIDYGCRVSGCTVHFVDDQYDHGPIIAQATVPVLPDDTAEKLAARVFEQECQLYPRVINALAKGQVSISGRQVRWEPADG